MRYATDIQLEQLIVHILDPWRPNGYVLSERTLPLNGNQPIVDYFVTHIQNSLQDSAARAARFNTLDDTAASGICKALLDGEMNLVEGSRLLAKSLYGMIARDRRISAGDLVLCFYRARNRPQVPRYLGLLKLDPSPVFRPKTEEDDQGKSYVGFEIQTHVLPTTRERLHKCAFIQPLDPRPEYDLLLLDRQVPPSLPRAVAMFFTKDFLDCELALDARQRTHRLYIGLVSAHNQLRPELSPEENETLHQAIDNAVTPARINLDTWLDGLRLTDAHKKRINQVLSQELPDREFQIDTGYAKKLIRKRRFRGDHGLRVEVLTDHYDQIIQSVNHIKRPGRPPYYRVVIHTEKWEEMR